MSHYCIFLLGLKLIDSTEEKAVDGLRLVRNQQCSHLADSTIADDAFNKTFTDVRAIYSELGWMKEKLDKIQHGIFETKDYKETKNKLEEEKRAGNCRFTPIPHSHLKKAHLTGGGRANSAPSYIFIYTVFCVCKMPLRFSMFDFLSYSN